MKRELTGVVVASGLALLAGAVSLAQGPASEFAPDTVFRESTLSGWRAAGAADWRANAGEITGVPRANGPGGWLISNASYQDLQFFARVRCTGGCVTGLLFRRESTPQGDRGIYVSLNDGDLATYRVTLASDGSIATREKLRGVGPFVRVAPAPPPPVDPAAPPAGRGGRAGGPAGGVPQTGAGRGGAPVPLPTPLPELAIPPDGLRANDWNTISVTLDADVIRPILNATYGINPGATEDRNGYGPVALYVSGTGEVRFKDVAFKDLHTRAIPAEVTSNRFRMQQLDEFYYAWGAGAADFNRDGNLDVVAGPYYYLGPTFTQRREIYIQPTHAPSTSFATNWMDFPFDYTGDGWPDVLAAESRAMQLYVNPRGENRRWAKYSVLPMITSEISLMKDLDGDGKPEIIFGMGGVGGSLAYGKPDPANPTAPWVVHPVSERGVGYGHGFGAGDINGDGRVDVVQAAGWWEQPPAGTPDGPWKYHPQAFGRWGRAEGAGGAEMGIYDVNGDGLTDVVTGLNAHGFGLAWFEQKRDAAGTISFVQHMILDDFSTKNAGGVTMSEMHAATIADIDGDGIPDFITGKRSWSHQESYVDPDPMGPPVLYWFRTVRNKSLPGGAEFVPELIHNRSGVGAQFVALDLNKDGAADIVTSTNRGTFVFWGQRRPAR